MARLQVQRKTKQRRTGALLAVVALALGLFGVQLVPASANLPGHFFDAADGNESVEADEVDWNSPAPNLVLVPDLAPGASDNSLKGSEDDETPEVTAGNIQDNKADLLGIKVANERVAATSKDYLYLSWTRPAAPSGTVAYDFELNKLAQPPIPAVGQNWNLNRSAGDILITFELTNGGIAPKIALRKWIASGASSLCDSNPKTPCWGLPNELTPVTTPAAEGSVNQLANGDITFGEMAVDLGLAGIFLPNTCTSFASAYAKSRSSGSSFNSQVSDVVAPYGVSVSNCGSLTVAKEVSGPNVAGDQASFGFTVSCPTVDFDPSTVAIDPATFSLAHGANEILPNIPPTATCIVTEAAPSPDNFTTTYTVTGAAGTSSGREATVTNVPLTGKTVTFTNARQAGGLDITKTSTGGVGTFQFSVDCTGTAYDRSGADKVSITTATSGTSVTSDDLTGIPTGTVCTVTEDANSLYSTVVTPSDGQRTIDSTIQNVSFANTRKTATLTVDKLTTGGTGTFLFVVDCNDGTIHDRSGNDKLSITTTGTAQVTGIPTGTSCTVTEDANALFTSSLRSPSASNTVAIAEAGSTVYFQNVRNTGTLTVSKTTTGGTGTFRFEVDCSDDSFDRAGDDRLTVADSGSATINGIPTGVTCTVTETANALFTSTRTPTNGSVAIDADGETVSFTNVRKTGSLTITKATTGGDGAFSFGIDCSDNAFDRTEVVVTTASGSGSSAAIAGIPTGTTCAVTETVPDGWAAVGGAVRNVTIDVDGETAAFSNRKLPSGINVVKSASAPTVHNGAAVTYTYVVTNTGENPLTAVKVVDDKCAPVTGPSSGDTEADGVLGLTEVWTYSCTSTLTSTTTNIATATGTDPLGVDVTDTDTKTVAVINPRIAIDKTPSDTSVAPDTTVVYTYTVTNPGDVPLTAVSVADDKCSPVTLVSGDVNVDSVLQVGETWVFRCSQVQTGAIDTLTNVGTASGTDPLGSVVKSTDTVTVAVVAPLVITQPTAQAVVVPAPIPAPAPAPAPVAVAPVTLPRTGIDVNGWIQLGASLILLGLSLLVTARKRRRTA